MNKTPKIIDISREIDMRATMSAIKALRMAGVCTGQVTYAQGIKLYGRWFVDAVDAGCIQPCRVGHGTKTMTRWFALDDIISYQTAELQNVRINLNR